ncbi:uncharacterized protein LOC134839854 [Symsagittifera roscoffensis]|uniref:uncharacterized protein LOC134839854 n=1 Tax=Symsagittifera roscoffensis TaxID=84072 RepID=UPI00307C427D
MGLFARKRIEEGEFVCAYWGRLVTRQEYDKLKQAGKNDYCFTDRKVVFIDGTNPEKSGLARQIEENEELEYNYGDEMAPWRSCRKCTTRRENYQSEGEEEPPLTLEILRAEQKQCAEEGQKASGSQIVHTLVSETSGSEEEVISEEGSMIPPPLIKRPITELSLAASFGFNSEDSSDGEPEEDEPIIADEKAKEKPLYLTKRFKTVEEIPEKRSKQKETTSKISEPQIEENEELEYNYGDEMAPWRSCRKCTTSRENYQSESEEEPPLTLEILRAEQKQCAEEGQKASGSQIVHTLVSETSGSEEEVISEEGSMIPPPLIKRPITELSLAASFGFNSEDSSDGEPEEDEPIIADEKAKEKPLYLTKRFKTVEEIPEKRSKQKETTSKISEPNLQSFFSSNTAGNNKLSSLTSCYKR